MRDLFANRKKPLVIASPIEDAKILRSKQCTQGFFFLSNFCFSLESFGYFRSIFYYIIKFVMFIQVSSVLALLYAYILIFELGFYDIWWIFLWNCSAFCYVHKY